MEPQHQGRLAERVHASDRQDAVIRRAVFTLDEGDVVIEFPRDLSKESVDDLADYLETFMKRARREARPKEDEGNDEAAN